MVGDNVFLKSRQGRKYKINKPGEGFATYGLMPPKYKTDVSIVASNIRKGQHGPMKDKWKNTWDTYTVCKHELTHVIHRAFSSVFSSITTVSPPHRTLDFRSPEVPTVMYLQYMLLESGTGPWPQISAGKVDRDFLPAPYHTPSPCSLLITFSHSLRPLSI